MKPRLRQIVDRTTAWSMLRNREKARLVRRWMRNMDDERLTAYCERRSAEESVTWSAGRLFTLLREDAVKNLATLQQPNCCRALIGLTSLHGTATVPGNKLCGLHGGDSLMEYRRRQKELLAQAKVRQQEEEERWLTRDMAL